MMRVTYYALKTTQVGDEFRQPGDLIPEANAWTYLSAYVNDGHIAPVLVVTLPQEVQDMLSAWEQAQAPEPLVSEDKVDPVQGDTEAEPSELEPELVGAGAPVARKDKKR